MVGNIGLLASQLSHLTKSHRPQKDILPMAGILGGVMGGMVGAVFFLLS